MSHSSRQPARLRRPLTLLHTSDLHIGGDVYLKEALRGFDAVVDAARQASVDALLVAGDLFDALRVPADVALYVVRSLDSLERPVVILPGNHDTFLTSPSSLFHPLPANLRVLRALAGELVTIADLGLSVWGRPVYDHAPTFHPLEGLPPRPGDGWYVALAHGLVADATTDPARSSPIGLEELAQADCDYIALGHVHRFLDVTQGRTPAFYSGAPSGTRQPTIALVALDPKEGVSVQAIHLASNSSGGLPR